MLNKAATPNVKARFTPATIGVTVQLKRRSASERFIVGPVGVNILTPDFFDGNYAVEWEDDSARVSQVVFVWVPLSMRDQFRTLEGTGAVEAYVTIDDKDLEIADSATFRRKPVKVNFPDEFAGLKLDGEPPSVQLRVVRKPEPGVVPEPAPAQ